MNLSKITITFILFISFDSFGMTNRELSDGLKKLKTSIHSSEVNIKSIRAQIERGEILFNEAKKSALNPAEVQTRETLKKEIFEAINDLKASEFAIKEANQLLGWYQGKKHSDPTLKDYLVAEKAWIAHYDNQNHKASDFSRNKKEEQTQIYKAVQKAIGLSHQTKNELSSCGPSVTEESSIQKPAQPRPKGTNVFLKDAPLPKVQKLPSYPKKPDAFREKYGLKVETQNLSNKNPAKPLSFNRPKVTEDLQVLTGDFFKNHCDRSAGSLSDHAPILSQKFASWNIAQRATGILIKPKNGKPFFTDKFLETQGSPFKENDKEYDNRLLEIGNAIGTLFQKNPQVEILSLQEVPYMLNKEKTSQSQFYRSFSEKLRSLGLHISYPTSDMDQAVVYRSETKTTRINLPFESKNSHRMALYCSEATKDCMVNVHAKIGVADLCDHMNQARDLVKSSYSSYRSLTFIGDFNRNAKELARECPLLGNAVIQTYPGEGKSCSDNQGTHVKSSVDIAVKLPL